MLVYIDDSGDPGFQLGRGSSTHFVIALVIFDDELEARRTALAISELRRARFRNDDTEFHFNHSSDTTRQAFINAVGHCSFRVRAIVFDKAKVYSPTLRRTPAKLYSYATKLALKRSDIHDARVYIDRSGDRGFRSGLARYLRQELNTDVARLMKAFKQVPSRGNDLIQLADMVAGTIRRSYDPSKRSASTLRQELEATHTCDIWDFA